MLTRELDYTLPERLIAQHPSPQRDASRLLVVDRATGRFTQAVFRDIGAFLELGDCLVLNDTRVIRARLRATKLTGGRIELFLLRERARGEWEALVRPSSRVKPGTPVSVGEGISAEVGESVHEGARVVRFSRPDVLSVLETSGEIPLPPYIRRASGEASDADRYQTVFATRPGAVAAPTAGLHFTPDVFSRLDARGVRRVFLTLHVGYGTFKPIQTDRVEAHQIDPEERSICRRSQRAF